LEKKPLSNTAFFRWGQFMAKRRWVVVCAWLLIVVLAASFAPVFQKNVTTTSMFVRDSNAQEAQTLINEQFSKAFDEQDLIVFHSKTSALSDSTTKQQIEKLLAKMRTVDGVDSVISPFDAQAQSQGLIAKDEQTGLAVIGLVGTEEKRKETVNDLQKTIEKATKSTDLDVYLTGNTPMMIERISDVRKCLAFRLLSLCYYLHSVQLLQLVYHWY
jgi:RND superfamily putative drug exporter